MSGEVGVSGQQEGCGFEPALRSCLRAAREERTLRAQRCEIRRLAAHRCERGNTVDAWDALQEAESVWMPWPPENRRNVARFHDAAGVHNGNAISKPRDHSEIVRDQ